MAIAEFESIGVGGMASDTHSEYRMGKRLDRIGLGTTCRVDDNDSMRLLYWYGHFAK